MNQVFREHEIKFAELSSQIENNIIDFDIIEESLKQQKMEQLEKQFVDINSIIMNMELETLLVDDPSLRVIIIEKIKIYKANLEILTHRFNYVKLKDSKNVIDIGNIILVNNLDSETTTATSTDSNIRTSLRVKLRRYLLNIIFICLFLFGLFFSAIILTLIIFFSTNIFKIKN